MPSNPTESLTAEQRFRLSFDRLKSNKPEVLPKGTPVSQNNVAREARCDPSALRKSRFPSLIREIQAYVEFHQNDHPSQHEILLKQRRVRRSDRERLEDAVRQRDEAVSRAVSAERRIVELTEEVQSLHRELDEFKPPPSSIR